MPVTVKCDQCGGDVVKPHPSAARGRNYCNRKCMGLYRTKHYVGDKAANWRGGQIVDRSRVMIFRPGHPAAQSHGYVYRYRLVAEEMLGRPLLRTEVVHHIDGDESNDDPQNLLVITQSEHCRLYDAGRRGRTCHGST